MNKEEKIVLDALIEIYNEGCDLKKLVELDIIDEEDSLFLECKCRSCIAGLALHKIGMQEEWIKYVDQVLESKNSLL